MPAYRWPKLGDPLSKREIALIRVILSGHTRREDIALWMGNISDRTVQSHLGKIYTKTGADGMADLILMAFRRKWCAVDMSMIVSKDERGKV